MTRPRLAVLLVGIVLLAALAVHAGMAAVLRSLAILGARGFALVTIIHLPVLLLMGLAWWWIGRDIAGASPGAFIEARLVRDSVAEVLPFSQIGGFLAGLRLLVLTGIDAVQGGFCQFADLVMEFSAKLLYAMMGLLLLTVLLPGARPTPALSIGLTLAALAAILAIVWRKRLTALLERYATILVARWAPPRSGPALRSNVAHFFALDRSAPGFAIHIVCWLFGAVEGWVTLRLMGTAVTGSEALVIDSLATTLRTFGFLVPAAIGVQEAAYVLACGLFGIAPAEAVAFSLTRRARDLSIGLLGLAAWQFLEARIYRRNRSLDMGTAGT